MPVTFFARPSTSSTTIVLDPTTGQPVVSPTCPVPLKGDQGIQGNPGRGIDMVEASGSTLSITFTDGTSQEVDLPGLGGGVEIETFQVSDDGNGLTITLTNGDVFTASMPSGLISGARVEGNQIIFSNLQGEDNVVISVPDVRYEITKAEDFPANVDRVGNWKCVTSEPHAPLIYFRVHELSSHIVACEIDPGDFQMLPGYVNLSTGQVQPMYVSDAIYSQGAGPRQAAFKLTYYGWAFTHLGLRIKAEFTTNGGDESDSLIFSIRDTTNALVASAQLTGAMEPLSLIDVQAGFAYPFSGTTNMYVSADSSSRILAGGATVPHKTGRIVVPNWAEDEVRALEIAITANNQFNAQLLSARLEISPLKGRFESPTP